MDAELFRAVDRYIDSLFAVQDEALLATQQSLHAANMPQISVSPNQGKLLYVLALLCNARRILEIGTLAGYSAIWMARALPDDGRLITLEHSPAHAAVAQANIEQAGLADKIELRVGAALELLPQLATQATEPFDMVFIDADKPPYADYWRWSLRLTRPGSLIVADNVIREGQIIDTTSMDPGVTGIQQFHAALAAEPAVAATVVQLVGVKGYDGMALAVVKR